jgi:hypothetical protein
MHREMHIEVKIMLQEILSTSVTEVMLRSVIGILHNVV